MWTSGALRITMNEQPNNTPDDDFDEEILRSLVRSGAAFPTTPEEVRAAKKRLAGTGCDLPEHLKDASKACQALLGDNSKSPDNVVQMPLNEFAEAKAELMRAARNGKEVLSAEVEKKMRANRTRSKATNG